MQNNDILEFPPLEFEVKSSAGAPSFSPSAEAPWPPAKQPPPLEPPTYGDLLKHPQAHKPSGGWAAFFQAQVDRAMGESPRPVKEFSHG